MTSAVIFLLFVGVALIGAFSSARCKHHRTAGRIPEDLQ